VADRALARQASLRAALPLLSIFVLAFAVRLALVLRSGGLSGDYGYDASVYYAAADALTHGRLPYRDFVLLHPPAIMLVLTPFAALGRLATDHTGFIAANLAGTALGALNAVLVIRVATAMRLDRRAALAGGVFYAIWLGAAGAEYLARLEPLGNTFVLLGLLAFFADGAARQRSRGIPRALLCGVALGLSAVVKIWFVVPLLGVAVWYLALRRPRRELGWYLAGAALAVAAVAGPFFVVAPRQMWRMVVTAQLERNLMVNPLRRLSDLTSFGRVEPHGATAVVAVAVVGVGALFVAAVVLAWRVQIMRPVLILGVVQLIVLGVGPSWFPFYADFVAVPVALVVAAAFVGSRVFDRSVARLTLATAGTLAAAFIVIMPGGGAVTPFRAQQLAAAVADVPCVQSDSPIGLIELNALDRAFRNHCQIWVDVTGRTYYVDRAAGPRVQNAKWQRDLRRYLLSGQAVIVVRRAGSGVSPATMTILRRGAVLATEGGHAVYRTAR
jgi:hypothetical protein